MAYAIAILGAFLIVAFLVRETRRYTEAPPLNANRGAERAKALGELRATETDALKNAGWIDQGKGIVRLPIETAMQLAEHEWQNPSAARSNLISRVEKATFVPPPPPAKPSAFE
jgi:hypothetical protein